MRRNVLTITAAGNPADQSCGTIDGEVLPREAQPGPSTRHISKAINALHDYATRSGNPGKRALALSAALELNALKSCMRNSSTPNART
jgi:hypothetical protein